jgi:hypothetical protein
LSLSKTLVTWTLLPNGILTVEETKTKLLKLSVFVSPRLKTSGPSDEFLSSFESLGFADWPARINGINEFSIDFGDKNSIDVLATVKAQLDRTSIVSDSTIWQKILPANSTFVRSYEFDNYSKHIILSYSVKSILDYAKETYANVGLHSLNDSGEQDFPPLDQLSRTFESVTKELLERNSKSVYLDLVNTPITKDMDIGQQFLYANLFHFQPRDKDTSSALPVWSKEEFNHQFDFHKIISSLGQHPKILRLLGLIIDLVVPLEDVKLPIGMNDPWIRLRLPEAQVTSSDIFLKTMCHLDNNSFFATPNKTKPEIVDGMLPFDNTDEFQAVQIDPDAAAIKLSQFAVNLSSVEKLMSTDTDDNYSLPTIRAGGISVINMDKGVNTSKKFGNTESNNGILDKPTVEIDKLLKLYAQDLMRGYRIDVLDESLSSPKWYSLCDRLADYEIIDDTGKAERVLHGIDDPGWIETGMSKTDDLGPYPGLKVHESLFTWQGWSLSVPRPAGSINPSDDIKRIVKKPPNDDPSLSEEYTQQFKISSTFKIKPKSLPRLRFGRNYRIRGRVVDIAGNSIPLESDFFDHFTPKFRFNRYDPVNAPQIILRSRIDPEESPGESLRHIVIRSFNISPTEDGVQTKHKAERHIAPSKTSELIAELHGKFDEDPITGKKMEQWYEIIKNKDLGSFKEAAPEWNGHGIKYVPGSRVYHMGNMYECIKPHVSKASDSIDQDPAVKSTVKFLVTDRWQKVESNPIYSDKVIPLPYLPDPIAIGATFRNLPGVKRGTLVRPNPSTAELKSSHMPHLLGNRSATCIDFGPLDLWPEMLPFRIILEEPKSGGDNQPQWDDKKRVLHIKLPKGEVAKVKLSSYVPAKVINSLGMIEWMKKYASHDEITKLNQFTALGLHWMITPFTMISLVHATQQPLGIMNFISYVDEFSGAVVESIRPEKQLGNTFAHLEGLVAIHGKTTLKVDVQAYWKDPLDDGTNDDPENSFTEHNMPVIEHKLNTDDTELNFRRKKVIDSMSMSMSFPVKDNRWIHNFGDTKYRKINYKIVATTRFKEYFNSKEIKDSDFTRSLDAKNIEILNSARPDAPKILYVIPTFKWYKSSADNGKLESIRIGRGLRVYMERSWFSSGEGELLGVVLWQGLLPQNDDEFNKISSFVTLCGTDPIWKSTILSSNLSSSDFTTDDPAGLNKMEDLTLEELRDVKIMDKSAKLRVVGYPVHFDSERKLWYADIIMNTFDSYSPFVRLALARYQPKSVENAHLSRIILADFVQPVPDRYVKVEPEKTNQSQLKITVTGNTYAGRIDNFDLRSGDVEIKVTLEGLVMDNESLKIDRLHPTISPGNGDSSTIWTKVADFDGTQDLTSSPPKLWEGVLERPNDKKKKYRIVIREYERIASDYDNTRAYRFSPELLENYNKIVGDKLLPVVQGLRLVYLDIIDI